MRCERVFAGLQKQAARSNNLLLTLSSSAYLSPGDLEMHLPLKRYETCTAARVLLVTLEHLHHCKICNTLNINANITRRTSSVQQ